MAFNLPLPTMDEYSILGQMKNLNALTNQNYENQIRGVQAQYAPYTTYADALSKVAYANMLPYQIRATMLSNPLLLYALKDNPNAIRALVSGFGNSIPNMSQMTGNVNIPAPNQINNGHGLINKLLDVMGMNGQGGNAQPDSTSSANPLATPTPSGNTNANSGYEFDQNGNNVIGTPPPANAPLPGSTNPIYPASSGDSTQTLINKAIAPYQTQAYKPGEGMVDPSTGDIISVPSSETVTASQAAIAAAKRVEPQLKRLAEAAKPFQSLSGQGKLGIQSVYNALVNPSPQNAAKLPTQHAEFQSLLETAPESLLKTYGLKVSEYALTAMKESIKPKFGETGIQYEQRILNQLQRLKDEQVGTSNEVLSRGFTVEKGNKQAAKSASQESSADGTWPIDKMATNEKEVEGRAAPKGTEWMIRPDGVKVIVHKSRVDEAKKLKYREV